MADIYDSFPPEADITSNIKSLLANLESNLMKAESKRKQGIKKSIEELLQAVVDTGCSDMYLRKKAKEYGICIPEKE